VRFLFGKRPDAGILACRPFFQGKENCLANSHKAG
jgi:hypothetical protein